MSEQTQGTKEPISIDSAEQIRAMLNEPKKFFVLGDRQFVIKDLSYRRHGAFTKRIIPFIKDLGTTFITLQDTGLSSILSPDSELDLTEVLGKFEDELPHLVQIICAQTDDTITAADVEGMAKSTIQLLSIVFQQMMQNDMVREYSSFFQQVRRIFTGNPTI